MRRRTLFIGFGAAVLLVLVVAPIVLAPRQAPVPMHPAAAIDESEQARIIEAMRPPKRGRPLIAIAAINEATEVADFLVANGVLRHADIADVAVVAERPEPIQLYPGGLGADPQTTARAFDERHPDGADYVVVPAMEAPNDRFMRDWIADQYRKGAQIVAICNGAKMLAAAGLLDGRRATGHWYTVADLQQDHPLTQWVRDRRYVSDDRITTSTGVTANVPVMMALVEAIAGRATAERVAGELGVVNRDARHRSSAFRLTVEHRKTFVRNKLAFWRHETLGLPLTDGVDEIALGLMVDAYSRTELAKVVAIGNEAVRSRHGLTLHPDRSRDSAAVDAMLPAPSSQAPAMTMERELPRIAGRYDLHTASLVALVMEYPWAPDPQRMAQQWSR